MSDYFGALLQSSGIGFGAMASSFPDPMLAVQSGPAEYGIQEVNEQQVATPSASPSKPLSFDHWGTPSTQLPRTGKAESASLHASSVLGASPLPSSTPSSVAVFDATAPSTSSSATTTDLMVPTGGEPGPAPQDTPHQGPALVQAAVRWIAAGESQVQAMPEAAIGVTQFDLQDVTEERRLHPMGEVPQGGVDERIKFVASPLSVQPVPALQGAFPRPHRGA
jgi:hypothetical protein